MTHLDKELVLIKKGTLDMMEQVTAQLEKARIAFLEQDSDLAEEVIHTEKRINSLELSLDRDCENILALYNPVAIDLRFVLSVLKIISDLERIGDLAEGIASYALEIKQMPSKDILKELRLEEMFDIAQVMMQDIVQAFDENDTRLARKTFKKDKKINQINTNSSSSISKMVQTHPELVQAALFMFSTIRKIERIGDHVKNISEEIIFYLEAKVLRHKKKKSKKQV